VILWRLLPWQQDVQPTSPGGALWFPRELQGAGRHDNPERYGCLYVSESPVSTVCEALAPFRGAETLTPGMLVRAGVPLALAQLALAESSSLIDLDDPNVLNDVELRPSEVATGHRVGTKAYAARLYHEQPTSAGLRWWSTIEASFLNITLFDRCLPSLRVIDVTSLPVLHPTVRVAADLLGLKTSP
jgi:RES domain